MDKNEIKNFVVNELLSLRNMRITSRVRKINLNEASKVSEISSETMIDLDVGIQIYHEYLKKSGKVQGKLSDFLIGYISKAKII